MTVSEEVWGVSLRECRFGGVRVCSSVEDGPHGTDGLHKEASLPARGAVLHAQLPRPPAAAVRGVIEQTPVQPQALQYVNAKPFGLDAREEELQPRNEDVDLAKRRVHTALYARLVGKVVGTVTIVKGT